jgi:nitrite reductase (NADH) large subunit
MSEGRRALVIVGNGMVGHRLVEELIARGAHERWRITVLGDESRPAYDRVHLTSWFDGAGDGALALCNPADYAAAGVELRTGVRATGIDVRARRIVLEGGWIPYDALVLATGARPFVPPIPGHQGKNRFVYRTLDDLAAIAAAARPGGRGVVVGGGLLGLEAAGALKTLGVATTIIELAPHLMAQQIDDVGGTLVRRRIEALGIRVETSARSAAVTDVADTEDLRVRVERVTTGPGGTNPVPTGDTFDVDADLVVFSAGVRPCDELARAARLGIGQRGGVAVDDTCRTSAPDVFAIGDCASYGGRPIGLVGPGYEMARVVAAQLDGDDGPRFTGGDTSTRLKLLGVDVGSIGDAQAQTPGATTTAIVDHRRGIYKKLILAEDGSRVLGAVLVGDNADYPRLAGIVDAGTPPPAEAASLLVASAAPAAAPTGDATRVCTCNGVTCGALRAAIGGGACDMASLKKATRAGTGCGGCLPQVAELLTKELTARGVAVSRAMCEHFAFSRQELFHLVKVEKIETFGALLARHGSGAGCEICKPAVASILASAWNQHVLARPHAPIQDSNDTFLANIQKDGTYSVVPRVPGGEITPDQLLVIGTVAKKYDLYTKITGGQRIDLFGARVDQLPAIWSELVAAGFESGHAYGKAVRTVKTCVGSSWCRYGVQDSVGVGIRLEHRYKGLRAPHKIKLAVSGCTRECAEAQSKDVGVIATERGYNLYVAGNGGARPRHADLFAEDLDEATLVRYIDRFLMFYVRTADRLQRTARWLESLDGGLDYLRQVIIDDSLGIGAELDAEMAHQVATYRCEWQATLEDPGKLARFRPFVNTDRSEELSYVRERGQRRPIRPDERPDERVRLRVVT